MDKVFLDYDTLKCASINHCSYLVSLSIKVIKDSIGLLFNLNLLSNDDLCFLLIKLDDFIYAYHDFFDGD